MFETHWQQQDILLFFPLKPFLSLSFSLASQRNFPISFKPKVAITKFSWKMQRKIWYYEKWVGRYASFPPRRSVNSYWHKEVNFFVTIVLKVDGCPRFANNDINKFNKAVIKFASSLCASIYNNVSFL